MRRRSNAEPSSGSTRAGARTRARTCVGCGKRDEQSRLIRFRRDASGGLVVSKAGAHGRSAYVHAEEACIGALAKSRLLGRSLKGARIEDSEKRAFATLLAQESRRGAAED